ncbi:peroxisomal leader peptide-processing protease [Eucyclogobius newberryi]|uniref:peroxisomal leader peptide-processing protease n=1 Tax=Eucyclogobius newberryi TaxID=166745 RepID=UPI003B5AC34E
MELADIERCCCVVTLSKAFSAKKSVSCSGVIVHPPSGTILCTGLPFSRFTANKKYLNTNGRVLPAHRFSKNLRINVTLSSQLDMNQCAQVNNNNNNNTSRTSQPDTSANLLMLVNCSQFRHAFQSVFPESHQWRFYGDEDQEEEMLKDAQFLSWFAVLKAKDLHTSSFPQLVPWLDSSSLLKGGPVVACGTPFGSLCVDLFTSTLSRGIISNLTGQENAIILTDARCLPGTEGGGLFALESPEKVRLVGVVVSPFGWKANEWIGLSLVCSIHLIFKSILQFTKPENPLQDVVLRREKELCMVPTTAGHEASLVQQPTVCLVDSGQFWGSGVLVSSRLALTCRHVVNGKSTVMLKFRQKDRFSDVVGDVLFSTREDSPYDLAVVKLRDGVGQAVLPQMSQRFCAGEPVLVVGYGAIGRSCGPSLTSGVLSKSISTKEQRPVMLQTTCAVQAGTSGGAVIRPQSGELLGIVSSNTKDFATNVTYPHLNFSIPVSVFEKMLLLFTQTHDVSVFKELDSADEDVRRVWRLQSPSSKL